MFSLENLVCSYNFISLFWSYDILPVCVLFIQHIAKFKYCLLTLCMFTKCLMVLLLLIYFSFELKNQFLLTANFYMIAFDCKSWLWYIPWEVNQCFNGSWKDYCGFWRSLPQYQDMSDYFWSQNNYMYTKNLRSLRLCGYALSKVFDVYPNSIEWWSITVT